MVCERFLPGKKPCWEKNLLNKCGGKAGGGAPFAPPLACGEGTQVSEQSWAQSKAHLCSVEQSCQVAVPAHPTGAFPLQGSAGAPGTDRSHRAPGWSRAWSRAGPGLLQRWPRAARLQRKATSLTLSECSGSQYPPVPLSCPPNSLIQFSRCEH